MMGKILGTVMVLSVLVLSVVLALTIQENQNLRAYATKLYYKYYQPLVDNQKELQNENKNLSDRLKNTKNKLEALSQKHAFSIKVIGELELTIQAFSKRLNEKGGSKTIVPIVFIPTDQNLEDVDFYVEAFATDLAIIQGWYLKANMGKTFFFSEVKTILGDHPLEYYCYPDAKKIDWLKVFFELDQREVIKLWDTFVPLVIVRGADFAGGHGNQNWGLAMLGDQALKVFGGSLEERYSGMGAIAHELGHAFNLSHPPEGVHSLMGSDWIVFPFSTLTEEEINKLQQSRFLK
jgi:hypothetical protein